MSDTISPERRSLNMSAIKSRDTKPEIYLRKLLFNRGLRYRKNFSGVFGHPDIYLPKYKAAVFVHGCYWHRHSGCPYAYTPKSRIDFWQKKFDDNVLRDQIVRETLDKDGIRYIVVWECTIKKMQKNKDFEAEELDNLIREIVQ